MVSECKEVVCKGIACEGGMQCTLCVWEKCIGDRVCRVNMLDINVRVREVKSSI